VQGRVIERTWSVCPSVRFRLLTYFHPRRFISVPIWVNDMVMHDADVRDNDFWGGDRCPVRANAQYSPGLSQSVVASLHPCRPSFPVLRLTYLLSNSMKDRLGLRFVQDGHDA